MSETKKQQVETEKDTFRIEVEEHERFDHIMDAKYCTSADMCATLSQLFSSVYADFEGCTMELVGGNIPTIALYFNHRNDKNSNLAIACSKEADDAGTKNDVLRRTRVLDRRNTYGDRYFLTEEGKGGLTPFIIDNRNFYKQDGSVNWGKLVQEVSEPNQMGVVQQYTKVSSLDPTKLLELIYGKEDDDNVRWVYGMRILRSIPTIGMFGNNMPSSNLMLSIERVSEDEVQKIARQMGLSVASGLNIIR